MEDVERFALALNEAQIIALRNCADGRIRDINQGTINALCRRGLILNTRKITASGRRALAILGR